jgi:hypothetical protein
MGLPSSDDFQRLETALAGLSADICGRLDQLITLLEPVPVAVTEHFSDGSSVTPGPVANPARTRNPPIGHSGVSTGQDGTR